MAMEAGEIERLIKETFPDAQVTIEDLRGDGDHYACHVLSAAFEGKTFISSSIRWCMQPFRAGWATSCALALQTGTPA